MGAAASSLSKIQSSEIARLMRLEYDDCMAKNMNEADLKAHLTVFYNDVYKRVTMNPLSLVTQNAKRLDRGVSKNLNSTQSKQKTFTRRKSFGEKDQLQDNVKRSRDTKIVLKRAPSEDVMKSTLSEPLLETQSTSFKLYLTKLNYNLKLTHGIRCPLNRLV